MASRNKPFFEIAVIKMKILVNTLNMNAFITLAGESN